MVQTLVLLYVLGVIAIVLIVLIIIMIIPHSSIVEKTVRDLYSQKKSLKDCLMVGKKRKWNEREIKLYYLAFTMMDFQKMLVHHR